MISSKNFGRKAILAFFPVIIVSIIVDTSVIRTSDFTSKSTSAEISALFVVLALVYMLGQFLVFQIIKTDTAESRLEKYSRFRLAGKAILAASLAMGAIIAFILFQIFTGSFYSTALLVLVSAISYTLFISVMAILSHRFLFWYKANHRTVVLLYGLSFVALLTNAVFSLTFVTSFLLRQSAEIMPQLFLDVPFIDPRSTIGLLNYGVILSSIASFLLTWFSTARLLQHHSAKMGKVRYWIVMSSPLIYFLSQFLTTSVDLLVPLLRSDPIFFGALFTVLFVLSKSIGGILFGIAFWTIARRISQSETLKNYLMLAAYGLILVFVSNHSNVLIFGAYPPFGLITVCFIGLSSYLFMIGIYSSAVTISQDADLRKSIRRYTDQQTRLLDSIGTAYREQEITKRVLKLAKEESKKMAEETGMSSSLTDEDVTQYLKEVLTELKQKK